MGRDTTLSQFYLGTVQVRLRNLCYNFSSIVADDCTGCCISDIEHNLPALISLSDYHDSLSRSEVPERMVYQVGSPPKLLLPDSFELPCLHGYFRLDLAKRDNLSTLDDWWLVDLYQSDISNTRTIQLREFYKTHSAVGDGEKYLHIRYHERNKNDAEAMKWRKLVGTQMKNLNQMLRNEWLCEALDKLEPFRSLWMGFQISSFPHILSWRCSQEVELYMSRMHQIWCTITNENEFWCDKITIDKLEGLAPQWSSRDRSTVAEFFNTNQVFPRVNDPTVREQILQKILAIDGFIPTFRTFFKHVKIIGPVMLCLRELFPKSDLFPPHDSFNSVWKRPPSVQDILLQKYYIDPKQTSKPCLLQYSEQETHFIESINPALYSYWQLCLSLLRHDQRVQKPSKRSKSQEISDYPAWMIELGILARRLGFESDEIAALCRIDPDLSQIRLNMRIERPHLHYSVSPEDLDREALSRQQGQEIFKRHPIILSPLMTTDSETPNVALKTHHRLFLPTIWSSLEQEKRYSLTGFGNLVLILISFFGEFGHANKRKSPTPSPVIDDGDKRSGNSIPRSLSIYSLPDAPQAQEIVLRSSAVYSIPAYPEPSRNTANDHTVIFWHLPASRRIKLTSNYTCEATRDGIKQVINTIFTDGIAPSFALVDKDGRLKLCPPPQIFHRRFRSKKPNDVYYAFGNEDMRKWILKELGRR